MKPTKPVPEAAPETTAPEPAALARYEVMVPTVTLGSILAYCGARVNLTPAHAAALNAAQPGTVKFLGI